MAVVEQLVEQDQYRIALILPRSNAVLVESHAGGLRLPHTVIPRWTRVAEQLTKVIRDEWGYGSIMIDSLPGTLATPACALMEVFADDSKPIADGLIPLPLDALGSLELTGVEHAALKNMEKRLLGTSAAGERFSRPGWVEEAREWIRASAVPHRVIEFNNDIHGSSAGLSALVRFGTSRPPAYWLKAVSGPTAQEYSVSTPLARLFPDYLPPLVAARHDWSAWVMEEAGRPLEETLTLPALEQAAHSLARLQIASVDHIDALFAAGCFDQRIPVLRTAIPGFIQYLDDAMTRQTSVRVAPIPSGRLHELGRLLQAACGCMDAIGTPDALMHNDMNAGNILFRLG